MVKKLFSALFFALAALPLAAQIELSVQLNRPIYMQHEPVFALVTLRNDTGRALLFGKNPRLQGFILFELRDSRGRLATKMPKREISVDGLVIGPGEVKSMVIPLNLYYDIDAPGTYRVHAYVSHNMLKNEYRSTDQPFVVTRGAELWRKTVGVPDLSGKNPENITSERTYSIRILSEARRQFYYLVVENESRVFGVVRIGEAVGNQKLRMEIDMLSRIHLLIPLSSRIFHYLSFGLDGSNTINSFHKTSGTIPMLYRDDKTGLVTLKGGVEARLGTDFQLGEREKRTATQLMTDEDFANAERRTNRTRRTRGAPAKDEGLVDLGKNLAK